MFSSLSVLLSVYNAEARVERLVSELLEVLPDLGPRFEVLVIDDGSRDDTAATAHELARRYPQVRVAVHGTPRGRAASIRSGLGRTQGEAVLVCDDCCELDLRDLGKLWRALDEHDAVLARPALKDAAGTWSQRVRVWSMRLPAATTQQAADFGYQLFRREALETIRWASGDVRELVRELSRRGLRWQEVEVRSQRAERGLEVPGDRPREPLRIDRRQAVGTGLERPHAGHWSKLKAFALGE